MKKELVYKNKGLYYELDKKGMVTTGFTQADNNVMKELCIDYHPNVAIVYFMLISHRHGDKNNEKYNQCFPSKELLGKETGLSEDTVDKCIKTLKDNDYILYRKGNSQYANQYFFPLEEFYKGEGDYLLKNIEDEIVDNDIEDISAEDNEIVEEVHTNDDSFPFLSGSVLEDSNKEFTPKGKYVDEVDIDLDIFDEILPPTIDNSVGYVVEFYNNMNKYYDITDETLVNNKYISKKVNSLVEYLKEELIKNEIDIKAEKVITDIIKGNKKSFTTSLGGKNMPKDFNKCTYIISCIQSNFTKKKLPALLKKNNKVEKKINNKVDNIHIDQSHVDGLNDYYDDYITLSDDDHLTKEETIRRINLTIRDETPEQQKSIIDIIDNILKFYKKSVKTELKSCPFVLIKDVVKKLNDFYGHDFLVGRYDGFEYETADNIIEFIRNKIPEEEKLKKQSDELMDSIIWKDKTHVENGITYGVDKNGFSYSTEEVAFDYSSEKNKFIDDEIFTSDDELPF